MKLLTLKEIKESRSEGDYIAYGDNGKEYEAHFTNKYGGVMFFCMPAAVTVIGYRKK